jgi:NADH-quinone oxidoreductase subunit A
MIGSFLISSILIFLSYVLVYQEIDSEKSSAYECGFQPFDDTRSKFNVKYYLVAILFMIFDLEIMYLFPWAISIAFTGLFGITIIFLFVLVLVIGFTYE